MKHSPQRGISIVEIVIAAAIIATSVVGIVGAIQVYLKIVYQNTRDVQAALLLDETSEALMYIRDKNETEMLNDTEYTVYWTGTGYDLSTTPVVLAYDMTSTVIFSEVRRNSSDQISDSGTVDERTQKATITIQWPYKQETKTLISEMLIHDLYE